MDFEAGEAERFQVHHESLAAGKAPLRLRQEGDGGLRRPVIAHLIERGLVDDVILSPGPQQFEKIEPALRAGGCKKGEAIVADMGAKAVLGLMPCPSIVNGQPGCRGKACAQHPRELRRAAEQPHDLPLGDIDAQILQLDEQARGGQSAFRL